MRPLRGGVLPGQPPCIRAGTADAIRFPSRFPSYHDGCITKMVSDSRLRAAPERSVDGCSVLPVPVLPGAAREGRLSLVQVWDAVPLPPSQQPRVPRAAVGVPAAVPACSVAASWFHAPGTSASGPGAQELMAQGLGVRYEPGSDDHSA